MHCKCKFDLFTQTTTDQASLFQNYKFYAEIMTKANINIHMLYYTTFNYIIQNIVLLK